MKGTERRGERPGSPPVGDGLCTSQRRKQIRAERDVQVQGRQTDKLLRAGSASGPRWRRKRELIGTKEITGALSLQGLHAMPPEGLEQGELTQPALQTVMRAEKVCWREGQDGDVEAASVSHCS